MVAAYVLIQTEVGKAGQVARAEARGMDDLGGLIVSQIQAVNGITRTLTCAVTNL